MLIAEFDGTHVLIIMFLMALAGHAVVKLYSVVDGPNKEVTGGFKEMLLRYLNGKGPK